MPKFDSYTQGTPNYVELMTPDQQGSADFYRAVLGWDLDRQDLDDQGNYYLLGKLQDEVVAGIGGHLPDLADHPAYWGVYLAADNVDEATAKVEAAGGRVDAGPFDVMDLGRMAAIADPTGARVNLWQANTTIGTTLANEPGTPIWNECLTPDVDRAAAFYTEILGTGVEKMAMEGDEYTCMTDVDGKVVGGIMNAPMEGVPPHWNVYFNVADADATAAAIAEHGGQTVAPNFDVPGIGRMGVFTDPQGAMFCLMQSAPQPEEDQI